MEVSGQLHAPATLAREIIITLWIRNSFWPQILPRGYGEEKIILLLGIEPQAFRPVSIPTEISGLIVAKLCTINLNTKFI
jgi:hypothetical protein